MSRKVLVSFFVLGIVLQGCGETNQRASEVGTTKTATVTDVNPFESGTLEWASAGPWRLNPSRDAWRHPLDTLRFFGVQPDDKVVEIWPGSGWYSSILAPYLKSGGGSFVAAHFDPNGAPDSVKATLDRYKARFADPNTFGTFETVPFGPKSGPLGPDNSVDKVLTFRNVHNWMTAGWAEKAFVDMYKVLKPGGTLGIEEHRANADTPQDPLARSGYVQEAYVIELAQAAGFEFVAKSEINANPRDTKDHPYGVWTLPPVRRSAAAGTPPPANFDRARYDAIGESDRMTLKFRKPGTPPVSSEGVSATTPVAPVQ
jgi:predicted methyltransferase